MLQPLTPDQFAEILGLVAYLKFSLLSCLSNELEAAA
jgi:hypothetical protein